MPVSIRPVALQIAVPLGVLATLIVLATTLLPSLDPAQQGAFATGLILDFTLLVPILVYLCLVRTKRLPWIGIVPTFLLGLILATVTAGAHAPRVIDAVHLAALPIEAGIVLFIVLTARRLAKATGAAQGDFPTRFRAAARQTLGARVPADVLTTEVSTLRYAFGPKSRTGRGFTMHTRTAAGTLLVGLTIAVIVETLVLHLVVSRWSHIAAWILTGLSIYGLIWMLGDFRALRARLTIITNDTLHLRLGLRWEADIPLEAIAGAEQARRQLGDAKDKYELVAPVAGATSVRIRFHEPTAITGAYAMRRTVTSVVTHVDDAAAFCEQVNQGVTTP